MSQRKMRTATSVDTKVLVLKQQELHGSRKDKLCAYASAPSGVSTVLVTATDLQALVGITDCTCVRAH
jgi:hypothetical protein